MAEIRHLENRHDVNFFCWGWSDLDKISQTGAEWHVDCGDMVKIETRCRILIWQTFGRIPWQVIPEPPSCHIAGCCHLANSMSWSQSYVSHCRVQSPGEFNDMSSQSHVSHCRVLPLGELTVMIPEPHATLQSVRISSAILKIVFLPYFIFLSV